MSLLSSFLTGAMAIVRNTAMSRAMYPPAAVSLLNQHCRGFKDKGVLKLRCKDCYFKKVEDRWWVLCNTHGRHKQRQKIDDEKEKWIVTHMTIGHRPFQKKEEAYLCNLAPPGPYDYKRKIFYNPEGITYPKKSKLGQHRKLLIGLR